MNQKGLTPLLIVLLIAATIGGYFIYQNQNKVTPIVQQTPQPSPTDETTNWKIYKDGNDRYLFNYPNNWEVIKLPDSSNNTIVVTPENKAAEIKDDIDKGYGSELGKDSAKIEIYDLPPATNVADIVITDAVINKATIVVGNESAFEYQITYRSRVPGNNPGDTEIFTAVEHNKAKYAIQLMDSEYKQIYNQILSTFKFTQ